MQRSPRKFATLFAPLLTKLSQENPTTFALPEHLQGYFDDGMLFGYLSFPTTFAHPPDLSRPKVSTNLDSGAYREGLKKNPLKRHEISFFSFFSSLIFFCFCFFLLDAFKTAHFAFAVVGQICVAQ